LDAPPLGGALGKDADMADESLDVTLTNNNNLNGSLGLKADTTSKSDTTSSETIEIKPLSQASTSSQTMDLKPVKVDSSNRQEVVYDPIRTDASSTVDVKPLAIDMCMRTGPAALPRTHICEPYHHRVGLTLLGVEVFGLAWSGESQTIVDDRLRGPFLSWGDVTPAPAQIGQPVERHHVHHHHGCADGHGLEVHRKPEGGGLRIRLGG
jgi:hypothetical protein